MDLTKPWIRDNLQLIEKSPPPKIPLKLHMIWVGNNPVPDHVIKNYSDWKKLMPHWEFRLWSNDDINLNEFSQEVIEKVHQANKGAQKADIMRYFIIEKYGGFYLDSDIVPIRSLDSLVYMNNDLVLYHDNHVTWNYIINCFFGASPNHPLLKEACKRVMNAELNTSDVHMKTGPFLWGTVISEVNPEYGKRYLVLDSPFFSNFYNPPDKFGTHKYAASWVD
jgi:mannosyltransferase OCH1-like enzyme